MMSFIFKSGKVTIIFLCVFTLALSSSYAKNRQVKLYKNKIAVSQDIERVNWKWWEKFGDPQLLKALQMSLENNFDILIADLKTQEAKNYINSARRAYTPFIKIDPGYMNAKSSTIGNYGQLRLNSNNQEVIFDLPLEFSYELDFWGKKRDEIDYYKKNKDFMEFEKNFIILSTLSDISAIYFNILKNNMLISLYDQIKSLKQEKLAINLEKYGLRLVARQQIIEIEKELQNSELELETLKKQNEELKNRFYLLVSGDKEKTPVRFENIDYIRVFYSGELEINTGNIANRPDVLMAESQIKMAKLDEKIAKKSLLPTISYKGDISHVSKMLDNFLHSESLMYRIGYNLMYELFPKGKNLAELEAQKSIYKQALKSYEKAVASSLADVNNSLIHLKNSVENYERAKNAASLDEEIMEIEREKLDLNLISREDFMLMKEQFLMSKIAEYESKTMCLIHSISLYKALGGNA